MKKILLLAAVTAVALSSCSKNEEVGTTSQDAISFGTFVDRATKATDYTTFADGAKFYVDAYFTGSEDMTSSTTNTAFMQDQEVTLNSTNWEYSPLKYWPNDNGDKVSFFAVSAAGEDITLENSLFDESTTAPSFTYSTAATAADQIDLLAASALNVTKTENAVTLAFDHVLSKVMFTAKTAAAYDSNTTLTITKFEVGYTSDAVSDGTYTYDLARTSGVVGNWENGTTGATNITLSSLIFVVGDEATAITGVDNLMLIPQSTDADNITVKITYEVATDDSSNDANDSTVENTATFVINPTDGLVQGKQYQYNISIALTSVTVSGSTTAWDDLASTDTFAVDVTTSTATSTTPGE